MSDATHTPNNLDVLIVKNIDVGCTKQDTDYDYNHKDYFQVNWSGHPHRIIPGGTKKMPRFLAEHYAKHLADHILMEMEEKTKRKGLMQSPVERPRVLNQILLGVDTWYLAEDISEPGDQIAKKVDDLNPEERAIDLGTVPNPMVGILKDEPKPVVIEETPEPTVEPVKDDKPSIWDDSKPRPTRKELFADCEKLGIEVKGNETVDELISKIKSF